MSPGHSLTPTQGAWPLPPALQTQRHIIPCNSIEAPEAGAVMMLALRRRSLRPREVRGPKTMLLHLPFWPQSSPPRPSGSGDMKCPRHVTVPVRGLFLSGTQTLERRTSCQDAASPVETHGEYSGPSAEGQLQPRLPERVMTLQEEAQAFHHCHAEC